MIHPDDVKWAVLRVESDAAAGRPFVLYLPDTDSARSLAAELLALPLDVFLARCRAIRRKYGDTR